MNEVYQKGSEPGRQKEAGKYTGISSAIHFLHRMISFKGLTATVVILLLIGTLGFLSLSYLRRLASEVVGDTLPRLALAGQANAYLADASRTVTFIFSDVPEERVRIRGEITELSDRTTGFLNQYGAAVNTEADHRLYEELMDERKHYNEQRSRVLELAAAGQREQAIREYTLSLLPTHNRIKSIADQLFDADIRRGEEYSRKIMTACTLTQIAVAVIGVAVFVLGFFFGLFR
jgi:methyl-accepting chemotaxis protein